MISLKENGDIILMQYNVFSCKLTTCCAAQRSNSIYIKLHFRVHKKVLSLFKVLFSFFKDPVVPIFLRGWNGKFLDSNKKLAQFLVFENNKSENKYWQIINNQKCQNNIKLH